MFFVCPHAYACVLVFFFFSFECARGHQHIFRRAGALRCDAMRCAHYVAIMRSYMSDIMKTFALACDVRMMLAQHMVHAWESVWAHCKEDGLLSSSSSLEYVVNKQYQRTVGRRRLDTEPVFFYWCERAYVLFVVLLLMLPC